MKRDRFQAESPDWPGWDEVMRYFWSSDQAVRILIGTACDQPMHVWTWICLVLDRGSNEEPLVAG